MHYLFIYFFLQDTVYHVINVADLEIALKYNCDYRRYTNKYSISSYKKQPNFYNNVYLAVDDICRYIEDDSSIVVLILIKICSSGEALQCDYCVQYVVDFE